MFMKTPFPTHGLLNTVALGPVAIADALAKRDSLEAKMQERFNDYRATPAAQAQVEHKDG